MNASSPGVPGSAVRGAASGVLFMAFFGTLWGGIGIGGMQGWGDPLLPIVVVLIGVLLLIGGLRLLFAARKIPSRASAAEAAAWKRKGIWFGIVFAIEGLSIGAASGICAGIDRFNLFFPIMAIIVGLHFLPLAALFQVRIHYVAGILLCLIAAATLLFVPETATAGGHPITAWWVTTGFGSALTLWGTGFAVWLLGRRWIASR